MCLQFLPCQQKNFWQQKTSSPYQSSVAIFLQKIDMGTRLLMLPRGATPFRPASPFLSPENKKSLHETRICASLTSAKTGKKLSDFQRPNNGGVSGSPT